MLQQGCVEVIGSSLLIQSVITHIPFLLLLDRFVECCNTLEQCTTLHTCETILGRNTCVVAPFGQILWTRPFVCSHAACTHTKCDVVSPHGECRALRTHAHRHTHTHMHAPTRTPRCNTLLQHTATAHCNTTLQQHTATAYCNTLQHTATHCNTPKRR